jgi:hypothetical protein
VSSRPRSMPRPHLPPRRLRLPRSWIRRTANLAGARRRRKSGGHMPHSPIRRRVVKPRREAAGGDVRHRGRVRLPRLHQHGPGRIDADPCGEGYTAAATSALSYAAGQESMAQQATAAPVGTGGEPGVALLTWTSTGGETPLTTAVEGRERRRPGGRHRRSLRDGGGPPSGWGGWGRRPA